MTLWHRICGAEAIGLSSTTVQHQFARINPSTLIVLALVLVISGSIVSILNMLRHDENSAWVIHTHEVQTAISTALSSMQDLETGQRGYLITGDDHYLEPLNRGLLAVDRDLSVLARHTSDNVSQRERISKVRELASIKLAELKKTIALRKVAGFKAAQEVIMTDHGKQVMDDFRLLIREMNQEEERLLKRREQDVSQSSRYTIAMVLLGNTLALLSLFVAYKMMKALSLSQAKLLVNAASLEQGLEDAQIASVSKNEFLASMSHEIRTPMNGVIGMLHLLNKEALNREQLHYAQVAKSSADSLLVLINDILDVSKVEAGKLDLEEIDFDLHGLFRDLSTAMALRIQDRGLEFILDIGSIKNTMVRGDPGRIRQIMTNLLANANKFTHQGEIVIRASLVDIENDSDSLQLRCDIIDTGIGIASDKVGQLFDLFTQADSSTTREYGGSGLGLSIVKQLCNLMGGDVDVRSEEGKGSQFSFHVNLGRSKVVLPPVPRIDMAGISMLIVDDNHTNLDVLTRMLERKSIQVSACSSGRECLDFLEQRILETGQCGFRIAILDMQMPNMDGAQLAKLIRHNPDYNSMSLVMMTTVGARGGAEHYADIGFALYVDKPAIAEDLYDALARVLRRSKTQQILPTLLTGHNLAELSKNSTAETAKHRLAPYSHQHLLLVEDNSVNQLVALGMLENLGLSVDVAGNGKEAIQALERVGEATPYRLVLMDCQMPVMDGFATTSNIRKGDAGDYNSDITIVAMTASVMQGDREKCLAAGMNDYLSKPIDEHALADCLIKWMCTSSELADRSSATAVGETERLVWDRAALLTRMHNKEERVAKIIQLFLQDMPELVSECEQHIYNKKSDAVINTVHAIKGVAANISGVELQQLCADMEAMASKGQSDELVDAFPAFNRCFQRLCKQLEAAYGL